MKFYLNVFSYIFILAISICSCQFGTNEVKYKIGFSQCCDDPWRTVMNQEMKRELAFHPELNLEMIVANGNSQKQVDDIRGLMKSGIDLLIVSPNESLPLRNILDSIFDLGMPIIFLDRKTETIHYTAFVGGNNTEIGHTAAKYLLDLHPEGAKVVEIQLGMTMTPAIERNKGFANELANSNKSTIVDSYEDNQGLDKLKEFLTNTFNKHPEINSVYAHTDYLAEQASIRLEEYIPNKKVTIIGIDGLPGEGNGISLIEDNIIDATFSYPTGGSEAIQVALSILNKLPFQKENILNSIVINNSNARTLQLQFSKIAGLQNTIDQQISFIDSIKKIFRTQQFFILLLVSSLLITCLLGWFLWRSLQNKQLANLALIKKNEEVTEKQIEILNMAEELKFATNAKVNFFTNISHELRTPLTLVIGVTDELMESKAGKTLNQPQLKQIQKNSSRLLRLINQLMDFRKVESNKMKVLASKNNIVAFISNISSSFSSIANQRNINFQVISKTDTIMVWFDPDKIDKVVFNLLSNAFKYTPDGGSIIISILEDNFENVVKINVEDSGIGIAEEEYEKIFEPFYQTQNSHFSGTGLGLSLSKSLMELNGGTITLQSLKDKGTRFTLTLPLGRAHFTDDQIGEQENYMISQDAIYDESLDYQLGSMEDRELKPTSTYSILVVEDNIDIQKFLKRNLMHSYQVSQAYTGVEAVASATDHIPDLVICDLTLPGIDGIDVIKALKNDIRTSHIPIIILTSRVTINQQIEGTSAGADAFIIKPFNIHLLEATIKNLIHNRILLKEGHNSNVLVSNDFMQINSIDKDFIQKINGYIDIHFTDPQFQVNDLCKEVNLSRSQLYRKTKSLLGENISDYIQNKRLDTAEKMLTTSDLLISEIAYASGFSSPDYFSTVFKHKYNMSPSQFRKGTDI